MNPLNTIVSWDGDSIGQKVGRATLADDVEEVRRVDQAIQAGNEIWKSWCLAAGGSVVEMGGDEGRVEVPAVALTDLEQTRHAYETAVNATCSVGVGRKLSESAKALLAAKLRGKNRVVFYDKDVEAEIAEANKKQETEEQKIGEEYLGKALHDTHHQGSGGEATSNAGRKAPGRQTEEHSEGEVARKGAEAPKPGEEPGDGPKHRRDYEGHFRQLADAQDTSDRAAAARKSGDLDKVRGQVATALQSMRQQLPMMAQLKSAAPQAYQAVTGLVQSVIAMGRELQSADETLEKAERGPKVWREAGGFPGPGQTQIPSADHPLRAGWDTNYRAAVASRYTNGDVRALKPVEVRVDDLEGGNTLGVANPARAKMYEKMLLAGDRLPPSVVRRLPSSNKYELVDGTHRKAAALAAGAKTLPAFELPAQIRKHQEMLGMDSLKGVEDWGGLGKAAPGEFQAENEFDPRRHREAGYLAGYVRPWQERVSMVTPHDHSDYDWTYDPAHPVPAGHKTYLDDERRQAVQGGYATAGTDPYAHFAGWLKNPAQQPVVVVQHEGKTLPVDGSHRFGYAEEKGVKSVPAIVGKLRKAVAGLPVGKPAPEKGRRAPAMYAAPGHKLTQATYDYSHLLPEHVRDELAMHVHHDTVLKDDGSKVKERVTAELHPKKSLDRWEAKGSDPKSRPDPVGFVNGWVRLKGYVKDLGYAPYPHAAVEPHSDLNSQYRGKGLGQAMYEALYAHAHNALGVQYVAGGIHSTNANALHRRLAAKHGFEYDAKYDPMEPNPDYDDADDEDPYPYGPYSYALKGEMDPSGTAEDLMIGPGRGVVFERSEPAEKVETEPHEAPPAEGELDKAALAHSHHRSMPLPVGTIHNGEVKVTHSDGKSSWKGVRAGMIQGQEPDAPFGGANSHPVSSREPGSR